jgi:hypothetical protein
VLVGVLVVSGVAVAARTRHDTDHQVTPEGAPPGTSPAPPEADVDVPGFPVTMSLSRSDFRAGDGGEVEVRLTPATTSSTSGTAASRVTLAIPLTLETWNPVSGRWAPTDDLYDMSRNSHAYWQPHDTGPAWYEWSVPPWGIPLRLPVDDLPGGSHRVCISAWRGSDDPSGIAPTPPQIAPGAASEAGGPGITRPSDAASISRLPVPAAAVTMCRAIHLSDAGPTSVGVAPSPTPSSATAGGTTDLPSTTSPGPSSTSSLTDTSDGGRRTS